MCINLIDNLTFRAFSGDSGVITLGLGGKSVSWQENANITVPMVLNIPQLYPSCQTGFFCSQLKELYSLAPIAKN